MAISIISICNVALARIGIDQTIEDLDDNTQRSRVCKLFYEPCRDQVLRDGIWNFASAVAALAPVTAEIPGWTYAYRYPSAALKIHDISNSAGRRWPNSYYCNDPWLPAISPNTPFSVMADPTSSSRILVTDVAKAYVWYTKKIDDPNVFDPLFASALAWKLASEIALPLKANAALSQNAMQMAQGVQSIAQATSLNEDRTDAPAQSPSITARY